MITFAAVADHVSGLLAVRPETLTPEASLHELGTDSLELVELVVDLQEEFGVVLGRLELDQVRTFGDLVVLLGKACDADAH